MTNLFKLHQIFISKLLKDIFVTPKTHTLSLSVSSLKSLFQLKNESFVFVKNASIEEYFAARPS